MKTNPTKRTITRVDLAFATLYATAIAVVCYFRGVGIWESLLAIPAGIASILALFWVFEPLLLHSRQRYDVNVKNGKIRRG